MNRHALKYWIFQSLIFEVFPTLILFIIFFIISGVGLSPLGTAATPGLLYKPQMIDEGDCGAIGGMKIGRGKLSTRRKPAPAPLCPPQIPHDQTRAWSRVAAVGNQRLTAWAMALPSPTLITKWRDYQICWMTIVKREHRERNETWDLMESLRISQCGIFCMPCMNSAFFTNLKTEAHLDCLYSST
jgi:hypothetical protein